MDGKKPPLVNIKEEVENLKNQKKKKKKAELYFTDNWDGLSFPTDKKKQNANKKKRKGDEITQQSQGQQLQARKRRGQAFSAEPRNENAKKRTKNEEDMLKLPIIKTEPNDSEELKVKPLSEWFAPFLKDKTKPIEEISRDILDSYSESINKILKESASNKSKKKVTNENQKFQQKAKGRGSKEEKELKLLEEEFLKKDTDEFNQPFQMPLPTDYKIFQMLKEEEENKDSIRNECTSYFKKSVPENYEDPPVCSKQYCTQFLAEPTGDMRPCRRGNLCVCNTMCNSFPDSIEGSKPENAFICREFLLPKDYEKFNATGELPKCPAECLLCNRARTTCEYERIIKNKVTPIELIQDHQNSVDEPGAYSIKHCIYPSPSGNLWTGIVRPIVKFCSNHYIYTKIPMPNHPKGHIKGILEQNLDF